MVADVTVVAVVAVVVTAGVVVGAAVEAWVELLGVVVMLEDVVGGSVDVVVTLGKHWE